MVTLGATIAVSGVRLTSPSDTFEVRWAVESTQTGEIGSAESVTFSTYVDGVFNSTRSTATRSTLAPNFSSLVHRRLPGVPLTETQAPVEGFGVTLRMSSLPAGRIEVRATAQGRDGTTLDLEPVFFFNDSDGVDRRPSNKVVYWDFAGGNDSNGGTGWGDAVATSARAISLAATGGICGGATIYVRGDVTGSGGIGPSLVVANTGIYHWLTFVADSGATWDGTIGDWMTITTPNPGSATEAIRFRFQNFVMIGQGPHFFDADYPLYRTDGYFWVEGGEWGSRYFDGGGVRARFGEDQKTAIIQFSQNYDKGSVYMTGVYRRGAAICMTAHKLAYNCYAESFLAGNIYVSGPPHTKCVYHSLFFTDQAGYYNVTRGIGANRISGNDPLEDIECQMFGSVMRILGPVGGSDFATALADNLGSTQTQVGIYTWNGASPHANNGVFNLLATGSTGGRPYVDLDNPSGVAGNGLTLTAAIETAQDGQRWNEKFHSSFLSVDNGELRLEGTVIRDVATSNIRIEAQSHFSNGSSHNPIRRLLIHNVRDAGQAVSNFNMGGVDYLDCIFRNMSEVVTTVGGDTGRNWSGTSFTNCVFNSASSSMPDMIARGLAVSYCHFQTGIPAGAVNCSTGTWLAVPGSGGVSPWSFQPAPGNIGTGDPRLVRGDVWNWAPSTSTMGALRNVALLEWSTAAVGSAPDIVGTASVSVEFTATATGYAGRVGTASGSIPVSASATGNLGVVSTQGGANLTISIGLNAQGFFGLQATQAGAEVPSTWAPRADSAVTMATVTPSDSATQVAANGIYVGGAGDVTVLLEDGSNVKFVAANGTNIPIRVVRVNSTGTTATSILAIY